MGAENDLAAGDEWPEHYRGFNLQISPNRTAWWQLYQGTDRLELSPIPDELVETFLDLKRLGGRVHITENGDVLTQIEEDDEYMGVYVGELDLKGELIPEADPDYRIAIRPADISTGDLWPSVYDGSRYSFVGERVWWDNGQTHRRHHVDGEFPPDILAELRGYKPQGGSFRITPWGDVITLITIHPAPEAVGEQFAELPRVVQNIIKLRKERGVEMLPIYVGNIGDYTVEVNDPRTLTDTLSEEERASLSSWASSLGRTSRTSKQTHTATTTEAGGDSEHDVVDEDEKNGAADDDDAPQFDDDPVARMRRDFEGFDRS